MIFYRVVFSDGSVGAWEFDLDRVIRDAQYFNGTIEEKYFNFGKRGC